MPEPLNTNWKKSSRSGNGGNCVEVRLAGGAPQVRDSKLGDTSPIFGLGLNDFNAFLDALNEKSSEDRSHA